MTTLLVIVPRTPELTVTVNTMRPEAPAASVGVYHDSVAGGSAS